MIKGNSLILKTRCPYFSSMFRFKEQQFESQKIQEIKVDGISKQYFNTIIQYIYSDRILIYKHSICFFVKVLILADYFILPRLIDICSFYLKSYVSSSTAFQLLLVANSHNAEQLERYCIKFIAMNSKTILESKQFNDFKQKAHHSLYNFVMKKI